MMCAYSRCWHEGKIIKDDEPHVTVKKKAYHCDCRKMVEDIEKLRKNFLQHLENKNINYAFLNKTINNLIYEKKYSIHYLNYALDQAIEERRHINYPTTLYYIADTTRYQKSWKVLQEKKLTSSEILNEEKHEFKSSKKYINDIELDNFFG